MDSKARRLKEFFDQFTFRDYEYDPTAEPLVEFRRLCTARQWGTRKSKTHATKLDTILGPNAQGMGAQQQVQLNDFFGKYEFQKFTYSPAEPPESEFARLCKARGWGAKLLKRARQEFECACKGPERGHKGADLLEDSPITRFFHDFHCAQYTYQGLTPTVEFERLTKNVTGPEWRRHRDNRKGKYKDSVEFEDLKAEFYKAVEAQFNYLTDKRAKEENLDPWEYVVAVLGVGSPPLTKTKAKAILEKVHVNIYDFIDYQSALDARDADSAGHPDVPKPTFFNNIRELAVYCFEEDLVYDIDAAKLDGTLRLLLKPLRARIRVANKGNTLVRSQ